MTEFICPTRIVSGCGAAQVLRTLEPKRLMVVTDPYFAKNGTARELAQTAAQWEIFDRVQPDPTVELAAEGTAAVKRFAPDTVVALGGGSAMDCAKAMVFFSGCDVRFVAVPTTSGSGSEVTDFSVLTHGGVKQPLVDRRLRPDIAVLDAQLLTELPPGLIADTGFDVLCHAVEALGAKNANPITDALARDAFCAAFTALPASYGGDRSVRLRLHTAATMAGMAFSQAGLGLCHAVAHSLGGFFHIPHGRLNAVLLPAVLEQNAAGAREQYARLAKAAGLSTSGAMAVRNLKNALGRLRRQLDMPEDLCSAGVKPEELEREWKNVIRAALEDPCCATNPIPVTAELVDRVLREAAGCG